MKSSFYDELTVLPTVPLKPSARDFKGALLLSNIPCLENMAFWKLIFENSSGKALSENNLTDVLPGTHLRL